jgi:WD40 repeat protein
MGNRSRYLLLSLSVLLAAAAGREAPTRDISAVAFSPEGTMLATAGADAAIRFWEIPSGQLLRSWEGETERVLSLSFSPDATFLASGGADGTLMVKRIKTAEVQFQKSFPAKIQAVRYSPDGSAIAIALSNTWVGSCDARSGAIRFGKKLRDMLEFAPYPMVLRYFPDGRSFATIGGSSGQILAIDAVTGKKAGRFQGAMPVTTFDVSPDGSRVAGVRMLTGEVKGEKTHELREIMFWEAASRKFANSIENPAPVSGVAFSPDGRLLAAGGADGAVTLWDLKTGGHRSVKMVSSTQAPGEQGAPVSISTLAFSPDGKLLAGGGEGGRIELLNLGSGVVAVLDEGTPDPGKARIANVCVEGPHSQKSWAAQVKVESEACPVIDGQYQNAGEKFTKVKNDHYECTTVSLAQLLNSWGDSWSRPADHGLGPTSTDPAEDPHERISLRLLEGKLHVEASLADGSTSALDLPTRRQCRDSILFLEATWPGDQDATILRRTLAMGRAEDGSLLVRESEGGVMFFFLPVPVFSFPVWTRFPPVAAAPAPASGAFLGGEGGLGYQAGPSRVHQ